MDPYNNVGAPYDPDPEDQLPDNQQPLNKDYLDDAAMDVSGEMLDDPEDIPKEEIDQLREAVLDDMPGDTKESAHRELESPNEKRNEFNPSYFDSDRNMNPDAAVGTKSVADEMADEDMDGDLADNDPDVVQRIG